MPEPKNRQEMLDLLKDLLNDYPVKSYCKLQHIDNSKNIYKYYIIEIKASSKGNGFDLICTYGRIKSSINKKQYMNNSTELKCKEYAEKLRAQKLKKGYIEVESGIMAQGLTKIV